MTKEEFKYGLENRKSRIVIAASDCVRNLRRHIADTWGTIDNKKLTGLLSQTRFSPVCQRELVEAILDFHDFETGSGKVPTDRRGMADGVPTIEWSRFRAFSWWLYTKECEWTQNGLYLVLGYREGDNLPLWSPARITLFLTNMIEMKFTVGHLVKGDGISSGISASEIK